MTTYKQNSFTDEEVNDLIAMRENGSSWAELGRTFNVDPKTAKRCYVNITGVDLKPASIVTNTGYYDLGRDQDSINKIISMRDDEGESWRAIGKFFGVDPKTAKRVYIKNMAQQQEDEDSNDSDNGTEPEEVIDDGYYSSYEYNFVLTKSSISISRIEVDEEGFEIAVNQETIDSSNENFEKVFDLIVSNAHGDDTLEDAYEIISFKQRFENRYYGKLTAKPELGTCVYNDGPNEITLPLDISERILESITSGDEEDFKRCCKFVERLQNNPSFRATKELYSFLKCNSIDINKDGFVVAYKKVRYDFKDIWSGRFDNSVGSVCSVSRNQVDEDSNQTCSYGLHVCSYSYLKHYGSGSDNKVVKVLIDPADFVAIPSDYSGSKARVCAYTVIEDFTEEYNKNLYSY